MINDQDPVGHRRHVPPRASRVFSSGIGFFQAFGKNCLGVIRTGMGHDEAEGCGAIRVPGGYVLGQDEVPSPRPPAPCPLT